jgi:nicotinamidase-related amidase
MGSKTALLVVDVQPVFLKDPPMWTLGGDDLVQKCKSLLDRARSRGIAVIFVQHIDADDMPTGTTDEEKAIHSDLTPLEGETVVGKVYGSAFMETDLSEILASQSIRHLVVCGLSVYGCVNETVLFAKLFGFDVTVVEDAVAAQDYDEWPTSEGIPVFLNAWKRGGISLCKAAEVPF